MAADTCATGDGPKLRWRFNHITIDTGVDACLDGQLPGGGPGNLRLVREVNMVPEPKAGYDGALIEGGSWVFDGAFPSGKIPAVSGGQWVRLHHTETMTLGGIDYALEIGTFNPDPAGDCTATSEDCSLVMDTDIIISGPGDS